MRHSLATKNASPPANSFDAFQFAAVFGATRTDSGPLKASLFKAFLCSVLVALAPALHADDAPLAAGQQKLGAPLAAGQQKFLGSTYSPAQARDFASYWNKVTPENAGKWGSVEAVRGQMDWRALDDAYGFAREHRYVFHLHVLVWGEQQPEWLRALTVAEQRSAIEHWLDAVAARYPDADFVEVVNEPLHHPPSAQKKDGGGYLDALGGSGASGWDWIVTAFRLARARFPHAKLLLNDYSISKSDEDTRRYRAIVDLLHAKNLVDGIGLQEHAFETTPDVPMSVHRANLDRLAASGVPIYVTEMDIDGPTDAQQLQDYQRVFPTFWEHPAVKGITLWGFRPGLWRSKQGAYLVREDGSERPALGWLRGYVRGVNGPAVDATRAAADAPR